MIILTKNVSLCFKASPKPVLSEYPKCGRASSAKCDKNARGNAMIGLSISVAIIAPVIAWLTNVTT